MWFSTDIFFRNIKFGEIKLGIILGLGLNRTTFFYRCYAHDTGTFKNVRISTWNRTQSSKLKLDIFRVLKKSPTICWQYTSCMLFCILLLTRQFRKSVNIAGIDTKWETLFALDTYIELKEILEWTSAEWWAKTDLWMVMIWRVVEQYIAPFSFLGFPITSEALVR